MTVATAPTARSPRALVLTLVLGAASAVMYFVLFLFADELTELARRSRSGDSKLAALVPLAVALVFSLVHGAFTGHFWDVLGLRPKLK
ncbi:MAG: hypothetical protein KDJ33_14335 [Gammaproteobacteria bacterium]|nr:hypothetical protein [Gammaproteobacteria bacterium]